VRPRFPHRYEAGKKQFQDVFVVHVIEARHAIRDAAWLQKNPRARADDLMEAFSDRRIAGIISIIGGDESMRLWPYLDFDVQSKGIPWILGHDGFPPRVSSRGPHLVLWTCLHGRLRRERRHVSLYGRVREEDSLLVRFDRSDQAEHARVDG
jgi:hypothetical protein